MWCYWVRVTAHVHVESRSIHKSLTRVLQHCCNPHSLHPDGCVYFFLLPLLWAPWARCGISQLQPLCWHWCAFSHYEDCNTEEWLSLSSVSEVACQHNTLRRNSRGTHYTPPRADSYQLIAGFPLRVDCFDRWHLVGSLHPASKSGQKTAVSQISFTTLKIDHLYIPEKRIVIFYIYIFLFNI